jgi:hypothetical protein
VAATCLFLAGKVEEKPARVSEIVQIFYQILFQRQKVAAVPRKDSKVRPTLLSFPIHLSPSTLLTPSLSTCAHELTCQTSQDFEKMKRTIENLEGLLLDVIEYRMSVKHPYTTMTSFLTKLNDDYVAKSK